MPDEDISLKPLYTEAQLSKYQSLVRLAARWLFSGDVTERIDAATAEEAPANIGLPKKRKASKISEKDLAVVLIDALSYHDGWVTEDNFAKKIQLGGKQVRRMLQFLQKQGFVVREHRRERKQGNKVESVAEQEQLVEEARTATYISIDYPHFYDMLRLRIHMAKSQAANRIDDGSTVEQYVCCSRDGFQPVCGKKYTSFDMLDLVMDGDGFALCGTCDNGIVAPDDVLSQSEPNGITRIKRARFRREAASAQKQALLLAVKPLDEQINALERVTPPDFGSFTDWSSRRQQLLRSGKATAREASGRKGGTRGHLDYGIDGPLTGGVGMDVELRHTAQETEGALLSGGPAQDPRASLPYFMQQSGDPVNAQQDKTTEGNTAGMSADEITQQQQYLEEFKRQYEAQITAIKAQSAVPVKDEKEPFIKQEQLEQDADVPADAPGGDMEWEDAAGDEDWEDA